MLSQKNHEHLREQQQPHENRYNCCKEDSNRLAVGAGCGVVFSNTLLPRHERGKSSPLLDFRSAFQPYSQHQTRQSQDLQQQLFMHSHKDSHYHHQRLCLPTQQILPGRPVLPHRSDDAHYGASPSGGSQYYTHRVYHHGNKNKNMPRDLHLKCR